MHIVEQVPLYQTVYLPILVHSTFLIKFFVHSHCLLSPILTHKNSRNSLKFLWIRIQFFIRNLNMLLVLKFERLMLNYHRFFDENLDFFCKKSAKICEKVRKYLIHIRMKLQSNSKNKITKMISEKFSTNSESFIKFGRGRRIHWQLPMDAPVLILFTSYYDQKRVYCCIIQYKNHRCSSLYKALMLGMSFELGFETIH